MEETKIARKRVKKTSNVFDLHIEEPYSAPAMKTKIVAPQEVCSPSYLRGKSPRRLLTTDQAFCSRKLVAKYRSKQIPVRKHDLLGNESPLRLT